MITVKLRGSDQQREFQANGYEIIHGALLLWQYPPDGEAGGRVLMIGFGPSEWMNFTKTTEEQP